MVLRPYTMLGDENGMIISTNICQKDKKSGTLRWSRNVQDFPLCQKCDTSSFHSDTIDTNLEIECVPDKSVRYRQSCKVQCKAGHSLFVAGSYKEYQGCKFVSGSDLFRICFGSVSGLVRVWFGSGSGLVRVWFGSVSGPVRIWLGSGSGRFRVRFGSGWGLFRDWFESVLGLLWD